MLRVALLLRFCSGIDRAASTPLGNSTEISVIHVVIDDLGEHDVGYRNGQSRTPTIDRLSRHGVEVPEFYTYKSCSPSRASLLTGRYPFRLGWHHQQGKLDSIIPREFKMLPAMLKERGWRTHALGKWHVGFVQRKYTPTFNGFDTFYGSFGNVVNYWTHSTMLFKGHEMSTAAIDFVDCVGHSIQPATAVNGTYSARLLARRAAGIVTEHSQRWQGAPLYIYLAFLNVHTPVQAPCETVKHFGRTVSDSRRVADAMLEEVDNGIAQLHDALQKENMLGRAIFIVHTDNGGETTHACNWPLRGGKFGFWEGGVRGPAFVSSLLIPVARRGTKLAGLAHIADWYATVLIGLAGAQPSDMTATGPLAHDSFNLWPSIVGKAARSPRTQVIHYPLIDPQKLETVASARCHSAKHGCSPAVREGKWKLMLGSGGAGQLVAHLPLRSQESPFGGSGGHVLPNGGCAAPHWRPTAQATVSDPKINCSMAEPCLFDIESDPSELVNLASKRPDVVTRLRAVLSGQALLFPDNATALASADVPTLLLGVVQRTGHLLPIDYNGLESIECNHGKCRATHSTSLTPQQNRSKLRPVPDLSMHRFAPRHVSMAKNRSNLLYLHLPKTGGSFIVDHLGKAVQRTHLQVAPELSSAGVGRSSEAFVIGSVREPCRQYLSLWAYGSRGQGAFHQAFIRTLGEHEAARCYGVHTKRRIPSYVNSSADIKAFLQWMSHREVLGLQTQRMARMFGWSPEVDCWVLTGSGLIDDLKRCLSRFEAQGGIVDWRALEAQLIMTLQTPRPQHVGECQEYFDTRLSNFIEMRDAPIFSYFGLKGCCARA